LTNASLYFTPVGCLVVLGAGRNIWPLMPYINLTDDQGASNKVCYQLRDPEPLGASVVKTGNPDAGVECYVTLR
jgi:hypothetical protein